MQNIKLIWIIFFTLVAGSALANDNTEPSAVDSNTVPLEQLAQGNQVNINKLTVGISKSAVVETMGTKVASTNNGLVLNPFRSEAFQDKSSVQYEILYYVTEKNRPFQPIKNEQMTPLIFKNGVLIGWGAESLRRTMELAK